MVAFVACQPENALLQNRVAAVPECQRETDVLMPVADSSDAVFIPAIRFGAGMVVRQILPGGAAFAVIFTNCSPRALTEVGSPSLPVCNAPLRLLQAAFPLPSRCLSFRVLENERTILLMDVCVKTGLVDYLSTLMDCSNGNRREMNVCATGYNLPPECLSWQDTALQLDLDWTCVMSKARDPSL